MIGPNASSACSVSNLLLDARATGCPRNQQFVRSDTVTQNFVKPRQIMLRKTTARVDTSIHVQTRGERVESMDVARRRRMHEMGASNRTHTERHKQTSMRTEECGRGRRYQTACNRQVEAAATTAARAAIAAATGEGHTIHKQSHSTAAALHSLNSDVRHCQTLSDTQSTPYHTTAKFATLPQDAQHTTLQHITATRTHLTHTTLTYNTTIDHPRHLASPSVHSTIHSSILLTIAHRSVCSASLWY